jgi:branched-chain amino acid transport system ATP-binding protein
LEREVTALLQVEGLQLNYGQISVCRDVSLQVAEGEIVTLIGANGAGKSTTLRAIAGALLPRAGSIHFRGHDITQLPSHERTGLGISLVPEGRRVFPFLTVRENLELGAFKYRKEAAKARGLLEKAFDMFPRLRERKSQNAGTLSGGEQQMLALGRAIMSEPHLICLDEPSLGLAPMERAPRRAERALCARDCKPRLRPADGIDHRKRPLCHIAQRRSRTPSLSRPQRGRAGEALKADEGGRSTVAGSLISARYHLPNIASFIARGSR